MGDSESAAQRSRDRIDIKKYIWQFLRSGRYQAGLSILMSLIWILFHLHHKGKAANLVLGTFGEFFGFLVGLAAVLILVSSMAVGLLLYFFQMVKGDQNFYYGRFRDCIADLRDFLDRLCGDGIIGRSYDEPYREIEMMMEPKELPLTFGGAALSFTRVIRDELLEDPESSEESEWIFWRVITRLAIAEDAVRALGMNLIQRVVMKLWVSPVVKSFGLFQ